MKIEQFAGLEDYKRIYVSVPPITINHYIKLFYASRQAFCDSHSISLRCLDKWVAAKHVVINDQLYVLSRPLNPTFEKVEAAITMYPIISMPEHTEPPKRKAGRPFGSTNTTIRMTDIETRLQALETKHD